MRSAISKARRLQQVCERQQRAARRRAAREIVRNAADQALSELDNEIDSIVGQVTAFTAPATVVEHSGYYLKHVRLKAWHFNLVSSILNLPPTNECRLTISHMTVNERFRRMGIATYALYEIFERIFDAVAIEGAVEKAVVEGVVTSHMAAACRKLGLYPAEYDDGNRYARRSELTAPDAPFKSVDGAATAR